jgi:hypothetical protein
MEYLFNLNKFLKIGDLASPTLSFTSVSKHIEKYVLGFKQEGIVARLFYDFKPLFHRLQLNPPKRGGWY